MATVPNRDTTTNTTFGVPEANQPFYIDEVTPGAVYDSGDDEIDVTVGPGRVVFANAVELELTTNTLSTGVVVSPSINTDYFVGILTDGTVGSFTTLIAGASVGAVMLAKVSTGGTLASITVEDIRTFLTAPFAIDKVAELFGVASFS